MGKSFWTVTVSVGVVLFVVVLILTMTVFSEGFEPIVPVTVLLGYTLLIGIIALAHELTGSVRNYTKQTSKQRSWTNKRLLIVPVLILIYWLWARS